MIKSVGEGLEIYKKMLKRHRNFLEHIRKRNNLVFGEGNWSKRENRHFSPADCLDIEVAERKLVVGAQVLRLTSKEWKRIAKECGADTDVDGKPIELIIEK